MSKYPEHDKLKALNGANDKIAQFLEWLLGEKGYEIARWGEGPRENGERLYLANESIPSLLASYFGIDQQKLSEEKDAMLEALINTNITSQDYTHLTPDED